MKNGVLIVRGTEAHIGNGEVLCSLNWADILSFLWVNPEEKDRYYMHEQIGGCSPGRSPLISFERRGEAITYWRRKVREYKPPGGEHPKYMAKVVPPGFPSTLTLWEEVQEEVKRCCIARLLPGDVEWHHAPSGWDRWVLSEWGEEKRETLRKGKEVTEVLFSWGEVESAGVKFDIFNGAFPITLLAGGTAWDSWGIPCRWLDLR